MKIPRPEDVHMLCIGGRWVSLRRGSFKLVDEWLAGTSERGFAATDSDGNGIAGPLRLIEFVRVGS